MCIIIVKDNDDFLAEDILIKSAVLNPHGLGVTWLDTFETEFYESKDWNVLSTKRPFIGHFRYATVGKISRDNCHPFEIGQTGDLLYQNGTVYNLGDNNKTDTEHMSDILSGVARQYWRDVLEMNDCRWVVVNKDDKDYSIYNETQWIERDGVLYSKRNVLEGQLVAVYGTLREGYGNNHLLMTSKHIGTGLTYNKYPMVASGIPFVIDRKGAGHHVVVDLYVVDKVSLTDLDRLESHPNWYERRKTGIIVDGNYVNAWLYFNDHAVDDGVYFSDYGNYRQPNYTPSGYTTSTYTETPDYGFECNKCGGSETIYDDNAALDWCFDCNDYVNHNLERDLYEEDIEKYPSYNSSRSYDNYDSYDSPNLHDVGRFR